MWRYMMVRTAIFLIYTTSCAVFAAEATWNTVTNLDGDEIRIYKGPGEVRNIMMGGGCTLNFILRKKEYLHAGPEDSTLTVSDRPPTPHRFGYDLGCFRGQELIDIREYYTSPDGKLGLSKMYTEDLKDENLNTQAIFFNGKNWAGIGIEKNSQFNDGPIRRVIYCLFGATQALCGSHIVQFLDLPKNRSSLPKLLALLKRIEFLDSTPEDQSSEAKDADLE